MTDSIYKSIILSKSGIQVPCFADGMAIESKYNPEREADNILNKIPSDYNFYIVTGFGTGIIINKLFEKNENCFILVIENSDSDYAFLENLESFKKLKKNSNIKFSTIEKISIDLPKYYLPSVYGNLKVLDKPSWLQHINKDLLYSQFNQTLKIISADFSVQAHFGKIWQNNIVRNIKNFSSCKSLQKATFSFDLTKTALIIAAGPTLDTKIDFLKENKNKFCIIATDTAYSILVKNKINPDVVVSIDGQNVSHNHFFHIDPELIKNTTFLFDITSNPDSVKHIIDKQGHINFFKSGHPLGTICFNELPELYTGSGTVTIAALDFAIKNSFKNIEVLGADFGFFYNKPYAKGSYFEELFSLNMNKYNNSESHYVNLFFRTDLILTPIKKTTSTLLSYQNSFESFLNSQNIKFLYEDNIYKISNSCNKNINLFSLSTDLINRDLISFLKSKPFNDLKLGLLPYVSYLRSKDNNNLQLEDYLNIAYKELLRVL